MAVARITADRRWYLRRAREVETIGAYPSGTYCGVPIMLDLRRTAREMRRGADRPGHTSEFSAAEVRVLARVFPGDEHVEKALEDLMVAELGEAERDSRMRAVRQRADARIKELGDA